jgi:hypothetical protein
MMLKVRGKYRLRGAAVVGGVGEALLVDLVLAAAALEAALQRPDILPAAVAPAQE